MPARTQNWTSILKPPWLLLESELALIGSVEILTETTWDSPGMNYCWGLAN